MQRWLKLPDGRYLDANRIMYVGKPETYQRLDEDGNDLGQGFSVHLGTGFPRDQMISAMGSKEEIVALLKQLLGGTAA